MNNILNQFVVFKAIVLLAGAQKKTVKLGNGPLRPNETQYNSITVS